MGELVWRSRRRAQLEWKLPLNQYLMTASPDEPGKWCDDAVVLASTTVTRRPPAANNMGGISSQAGDVSARMGTRSFTRPQQCWDACLLAVIREATGRVNSLSSGLQSRKMTKAPLVLYIRDRRMFPSTSFLVMKSQRVRVRYTHNYFVHLLNAYRARFTPSSSKLHHNQLRLKV